MFETFGDCFWQLIWDWLSLFGAFKFPHILGYYTDENIFDDSYYVSKSVLSEREIQEMCY